MATIVGQECSTRPVRQTAWKRKVLLLLAGLAIGLLLVEMLCRLTAPRGPFGHNPIVKRQADHVDLFEYDEELGHRLRGGGFVGVYQTGIISLAQIAEDPRRKGRVTVLNLGDSSTSGWDSNVVTQNAERVRTGQSPKSPLQTYKTYSDVLAEDKRFYVINAGVPGFSSLQGLTYLSRLLPEFADRGVRIDVVTVYFGNNDSIWNGNIEDKYAVSGGGFQLHLRRFYHQCCNRFEVQPRVLPQDYAGHLRGIARICRGAGIKVVFIEPPTPRRWPPGARASGQERDAESHLIELQGSKAFALLRRSKDLFQQGMAALSKGEADAAKELLDRAREADYVVPRIKRPYIAALHGIAESEGVPVVSISSRIPLDDSKYFRDYCHPVELANRLLVEGLLSVPGFPVPVETL